MSSVDPFVLPPPDHSVCYNAVQAKVTNDAALTIYKTMVLPYFYYCDTVYNSAYKDGLDRLQRLQKRGLKMCLKLDKRHSTDDLHIRSHVPLLESRRKAHLCNFMYRRKDRGQGVNKRGGCTRLHYAPVFELDRPNNETFHEIQWG